jgi:hypothetical protein
MRNQKILPRNNPSPAQSDRGIINVNEVIIWIRGVYGIENDGYAPWSLSEENPMQQKDKSDHEKGSSTNNFWSEYNTLRILWTKLDHEKKVNWLYDITVAHRKNECQNKSQFKQEPVAIDFCKYM